MLLDCLKSAVVTLSIASEVPTTTWAPPRPKGGNDRSAFETGDTAHSGPQTAAAEMCKLTSHHEGALRQSLKGKWGTTSVPFV